MSDEFSLAIFWGVGRNQDENRLIIREYLAVVTGMIRININTFFPTKPYHTLSWRHRRSRHWYQLDLIISRRNSLNCVQNTRSYHSADCNTDHMLVAAKVCIQPKKIHSAKQKGQPCIFLQLLLIKNKFLTVPPGNAK